MKKSFGFFAVGMMVFAVVFFSVRQQVSQASRADQEANAFITLHSPEAVLESSARSLTPNPGSTSIEFIVIDDSGRLAYQKAGRAVPFAWTPPLPLRTDNVAVNAKGQIYLAHTDNHRVEVLDATGKRIRSLEIPQPVSVAVTRDNLLVVGSPFGNKLVHLYNQDGRRLKSFGEWKTLDADRRQNSYLNRGKVVVDSQDNIYFVPYYAPAPTVQKFSRNGELLQEFAVEGEAVTIQAEVARKVLANLHGNGTGGLTVISSATVDKATDHLWLSLNGSTACGVVYEYAPDGSKRQEYNFLFKGGRTSAVRDLFIQADRITVLLADGAFRYRLKNLIGAANLSANPPRCEVGVGWPLECKTLCDTDCLAILRNGVSLPGEVIASSTYVGQAGCSLGITICQDGVRTTYQTSTIACAKADDAATER